MKLFLCSNFKMLAKKFLPLFFDMSKKHKCLFVPYADEEKDFYSESNVLFLNELGFDVIHLNEGYEFNDKIDMIYVKGGNVTQLIYYLRKFKQFDKIKKLVLEDDVLFAGQSAGAIVAGNETKWTLESEPFDINLEKEFGENGYCGFEFLDKIIFVHASKFRFAFGAEIENAGRADFRVSNDFFYKAYLRERKENKHKPFIVLKDNEAFIKLGDKEKKVRLDWSKFPVLNEYKIF